mmetsp:Transcript_21472/g.48312  ORF Transcript_21472/g.48312 Transcript_21472/m.48312 type:complete len:226 (+) Transcript_21472:2482-3159(+)
MGLGRGTGRVLDASLADEVVVSGYHTVRPPSNVVLISVPQLLPGFLLHSALVLALRRIQDYLPLALAVDEALPVLAFVLCLAQGQEALVAEGHDFAILLLGDVQILGLQGFHFFGAGAIQGQEGLQGLRIQAGKAARRGPVQGLGLEPEIRQLVVLIALLHTQDDVLVLVLVFDHLAMRETTSTCADIVPDVVTRKCAWLLEIAGEAEGGLQGHGVLGAPEAAGL